MSTSSKGVCKECEICYRYEVGIQDSECDPPCYLDSEDTSNFDQEDQAQEIDSGSQAAITHEVI